MSTYVMALKGKGNELNEMIWNTQAHSMSEAKDYFVRLKNLPEQEFDKLFVVAEVKDVTTTKTKRRTNEI